MGIDITLYLTRPGTTLENIIQQDKIGENEGQYFAIGVRENADLPLEHTCFVKRPQLNGTRWSDWLGSTFEFGELIPQNQSTGCVLSLHIGGRVFVLAFGTGRHAIRPTAIEYDFGLRVALHKVDPQRLRNLISKTVDIRTIERSTYHHTGGPVIYFSMDLDVEWLRSVEGVAAPGEAFTAAAGTDAIRLKNYSRPLAEIADLCQNLLSAYQADVPESFAFANNVRPVATKDPLHQTLEEEFVAMVNGGNRDGLEVIVDWAVVDRMASARLYFSHTDAAVNELSADQIWTGVNALIAQLPDLEASRIKLEIFDENQERVKLFSLLDVVQAELLHSGDTYLRIERRWFSVGEDYVQQINRRIQDLPSLTGKLALPVWSKAVNPREENYNNHVAHQKGWLLQDQQFLFPGNGARVEPCDLLTQNGHFIHVKQGNSSSCLNHLFGQMTASAELYVRHEPSRKEMQDRYIANWPGESLANHRPIFVAAIGRHNVVDDLLGRMLIAKINLLEHSRRIRALGMDFAVAGFTVS